MKQSADTILTALRARQFSALLADPEDKEALFRDLLTMLTAAGFAVVKPSVLECNATQQIKSCLRVAHYEAQAGHIELAQQKIDVAICVTAALEDWLLELGRLGTQVPLTWSEHVQAQYKKNFLGKTAGSANLNSNGSKDEIGIISIQQQEAEGF